MTSGVSTSLKALMARAATSTILFKVVAGRVLGTAAPAKPTQPFTVGVASDDLRR